MKNLKILIVENDKLIADDIAANLSDAGLEITGIVDNGKEAISCVLELEPDLLLLDIKINGEMDGIEVANEINKLFPLPIIFLTAHSDPERVGRLLRTHPYAYLKKPFDHKEVLVNIELAINNFIRSAPEKDIAEETLEQSHPEKTYIVNDSLFIRGRDKRFYKESISDIYYIRSDGSYIDVVLKEKKYKVAINLSEFQRKVEKKEFLRVHKQFIVNLDKVEIFEKHQLIVNDTAIPIGKDRRESIRSRFLRI